MEEIRKPLEDGLAALGITPPPDAVSQLLHYGRSLVEQNRVMNLTAITEPMKICQLHFLDSAALLPHQPMAGKRLIDVGTGAGFPGLVLKILEPRLELTLLDSLAKRLQWLEGLCQELGINDVTFLHARAEEGGQNPALREQFDLATARAVAPLSLLCELCLPYVRPGGAFLAMKTGHDPAELDGAQQIIAQLGGALTRQLDYTLPFGAERRQLLFLEKAAPTPAAYPRRWSKIKQGTF